MRTRKFPIVGDGGGVWSFVHLDDAAAATVLALEHDGSGVYNIVDDEPVATSVWLPQLAKVVGAKPPSGSPFHGEDLRGRGPGRDGDGVPRRVQRQGQARARLDPPLRKLEAGIRRRIRVTPAMGAPPLLA